MGNATNATLYNYEGRGLALLSARAPTRRESFNRSPATALLLLILYLYLTFTLLDPLNRKGTTALDGSGCCCFRFFNSSAYFPRFVAFSLGVGPLDSLAWSCISRANLYRIFTYNSYDLTIRSRRPC